MDCNKEELKSLEGIDFNCLFKNGLSIEANKDSLIKSYVWKLKNLQTNLRDQKINSDLWLPIFCCD